MPLKSVDIAFPVYWGNEPQIENAVRKVWVYCEQHLQQYDWGLVMGVNGPNPERTLDLCRSLEHSSPHVRHTYTRSPGKGAGLRSAWESSNADIVAYMDIDLSADIASLPELFDGLKTHDLCVGSRYHQNSRVQRSVVRRVASAIYNSLILRWFLGIKTTDLHCGFKAFRREVAQRLLPYVQDPGWYFDSEIMVLAEKLGYSITTIPVVWNESPISGLVLRRAIPAFLLKTLELRWRPLPKEIRREFMK